MIWLMYELSDSLSRYNEGLDCSDRTDRTQRMRWLMYKLSDWFIDGLSVVIDMSDWVMNEEIGYVLNDCSDSFDRLWMIWIQCVYKR